jgi:hypothetical protein
VKRWSWETSWLVAGVFSWLVAPWFFAMLNTKDVIATLSETPKDVWGYTYLFGALWGLGGLTFGLTMRYLGMSLGMAVALGYCTVFGTLIPPLFKGEFAEKLLNKPNGRMVLAGLVVCVIGIVVTALAGRAKESEMSDAEKRETVKEFNFKKGILVATFSGIMSACFAFGLSSGDKIGEISRSHGTAEIWSGLPVLIVVLLGGFTTNFIWCVMLNVKNKTGYEYLAAEQRHQRVMERGTVRPARDHLRIGAIADVEHHCAVVDEAEVGAVGTLRPDAGVVHTVAGAPEFLAARLGAPGLLVALLRARRPPAAHFGRLGQVAHVDDAIDLVVARVVRLEVFRARRDVHRLAVDEPHHVHATRMRAGAVEEADRLRLFRLADIEQFEAGRLGAEVARLVGHAHHVADHVERVGPHT